MPVGADTVVIKENVRVEGNRVIVRAGEKPGGNVRSAGEDFAHGSLALAAGTSLRAAQLGVLAALGIAEVPVRRTLRAAVIATGNELVPVEQPLGFGEIHDSHGTMLPALLRESGAEIAVCLRVRDDPAMLRRALLEAAADADHLPRVLAELGEIHFHKVRIKPGMPMLFGRIGACLVFGLPGNPVSA